jgi:hypothetical protein
MKLPDDKSIRYVGFVDEAEKLSAMAGAVAVVQPSKMESLSIVTLEAFSVGTPVVANAASRVLIDHCRKANAGLYYGDFEEFEEIVGLLLSDRNLGRNLGKNGQRYIKDNYGWQKLLSKYELAFRASARPVKEPKDARRRDRAEAKDESRSRRRDREPADAKPDEPTPEEPKPTETAEAPREAPAEEPPRAEAVSEADDPDATVAADKTVRPATRERETTAPAGGPRPTPVSDELQEPAEPGEAAASAESAETAEGEGSREQPPESEESEEPVEEEVAEDVAHLPSFFRAAIPSRPDEPPVKPAGEARSKPTPPPPPPPPPDGELPEFFRPKPKTEEESAAEPTQTNAETDDGSDRD